LKEDAEDNDYALSSAEEEVPDKGQPFVKSKNAGTGDDFIMFEFEDFMIDMHSSAVSFLLSLV